MVKELNKTDFLKKLKNCSKTLIGAGALAFALSGCQTTQEQQNTQSYETNTTISQSQLKDANSNIDPYLTEEFDSHNFDFDNFKPPLLNVENFKYIIDNEIDGIYKDEDGSQIILLFNDNPSLKTTLELHAIDANPNIQKTLDLIIEDGNYDKTCFVNLNGLMSEVDDVGELSLDELDQIKDSELKTHLYELEDKSLFQDYRIINISKDQLKKYTQNTSQEYTDSFNYLVINHELAHSHLHLEKNKIDEFVIDLYKMFNIDTKELEDPIYTKTLKGEIYADTFGLLKVADHLKTKYGDEEGLKFKEFAEDFKTFREFGGGTFKNGEIKRNFNFDFDNHFTLPTNIAVTQAIIENWDNIGKHKLSQLKDVSYTASKFGGTDFTEFYKEHIRDKEASLEGSNSYLDKLINRNIGSGYIANAHAQNLIGYSIKNCGADSKSDLDKSREETLKSLVSETDVKKTSESCLAIEKESKVLSSKLKL